MFPLNNRQAPAVPFFARRTDRVGGHFRCGGERFHVAQHVSAGYSSRRHSVHACVSPGTIIKNAPIWCIELQAQRGGNVCVR